MEMSVVDINKVRSFNIIERASGARFTTLFGALTEASLDSVASLRFSGGQGHEPTWQLPSSNGALLQNLPCPTSYMRIGHAWWLKMSYCT